MRESLRDFCIREGRQELLDPWGEDTKLPGQPAVVACGGRYKVRRPCEKGHRENPAALLVQWDSQANLPFTPESIPYGSTKKVWWKCEKGHRWQGTVNSRTAGRTDCPYCSRKAAWPGENDLASRYPDLAQEWHPSRNLPLTPSQVLPGSEQKVWWRCRQGHEWRTAIYSRTDGCGCPVCANRTAAAGANDLASRFPNLAEEWHPTKNGMLKPCDVTFGTKRQVWWRCPLGHEYIAAVGMRTMKNSGCPYCTGKKVLAGFNDLATTHPKIAVQWHPELNGLLTPRMVTAGSHKKVWWICSEGHVWKAVVYSRTGKQQRGCPVCAGIVKGKRKILYEKMLAEAKGAYGCDGRTIASGLIDHPDEV